MSPRTSIWGACRALAIRARPVAPRPAPFVSALPRNRWYSNDGNDQPPKAIDNDQRIQDVSIPDGVDVPSPPRAKGDAEVNSEPAASSEEVIDDATLEQLFYGGRPQSSPTEGGLTQAQEDVLYREGTIPPAEKAEALVAQAEQAELDSPDSTEVRNPGHKFGLPRRPWPEGLNMKKRYHPVLEQITRLLMKDGKLSVAQRNMAIVMNYLRTAPPPIYSPKYPLLPGTPPAPHLPLNPILYITVAVDSVAPLLKIRNVAGAGGGGRALELPVPLGVRQRRRIAFQWILDVINKKPSKGSGRKQFPYRIAEEIVAVVEGRSGVWEKRKTVHKLGTAARANVGSNKLKVKKKM
ncbi:ribosomal protein S7 domain-containing protein [Fusarium flagelliforme]|nr:ribosomal protein S7 domain-containing protein [Fusarium flagelliforme]KAH7185822.1 ribosomal protein S7 domain-containing protein [Fusarium flagelliforme]